MAGETNGSGPKKSKKFWLWPFGSTERTIVAGIICILLAIVLTLVVHPNDTYATRTVIPEQSGSLKLPAAGFNWTPPTIDFIVDLLKELGIAFLIAAVIAEGIERIAYEKQTAETRDAIKKIGDQTQDAINKVKTNLLEAVYETKSAEVFFAPFKKYVLEQPLIRTDCNLQININEEQKGSLDANSIVILDVTITYTIENSSKKGEDFSIPSYMEQPWPGIDRNSSVIVKKKYANSDKYEPVDIILNNSESGVSHFSYTIRVEALSRCDMITSYKLFMFGRDRSSFVSIIPTDKMNIFFNYTPLIDLFYNGIHSSDFVDKSVASGDGKLQLLAAEPLFPGNGIEFWWCPRGTPPVKEGAAHANIPTKASV